MFKIATLRANCWTVLFKSEYKEFESIWIVCLVLEATWYANYMARDQSTFFFYLMVMLTQLSQSKPSACVAVCTGLCLR